MVDENEEMAASSRPPGEEDDDTVVRCAICLESTALVQLPCCEEGGTESTTRFCLECLRTLVSLNEIGAARCPKCREWIGIAEDRVVRAAARGHCRICRQDDKALVDARTCDACFFGLSHPLRYECQRCHRLQRIPHPMYRYQEAPERFGTVTWSCHYCQDYTFWRARDPPPNADYPPHWPNDDLFNRVRHARNIRQEDEVEERRGAWCLVS